ncbi:sensor histidine kinase [Rheinheimera marina]|uniref:Sensor histidine kinase n=1 Tax=Rheinheimera marina TaxID=1774958 RepID=A0ABV9JQQ6_9GAMM
MNRVKTLALLAGASLLFSLYLALLQTAPGQSLQWHPDAPVWLTLQAALALWLNRTTDRLLWAKHRTTSLLRRFSLSLACSALLFVGLMTLLQLLLDLAWQQSAELQQYLRVALMYLLLHSLIAGVDSFWRSLKQQQQQQLALIDAEQSAQRYKLQTLQQQLDPHFLFNNMNLLSVLIHKDADKAEEFLQQFADFYRLMLQHSSQPLVSLRDELELAQLYMALQQQRFGQAYQLTIQPELKGVDAMLVPASLQLLLENALKHNQASAEQPLQINISYKQQWLNVSHQRQPKAHALPGTGTGLANLQQRCQQILGQPLIVQAGDYQFEVKLPLQRKDITDALFAD